MSLAMNEDRAYVICHMMTSLDGKITFGTINGKEVSFSVFNGFMDLYDQTYEKLNPSAWMCGRVTMDEFDEENKISLDSFKNEIVNINEDYIVKNELNRFSVGIDVKGLLRWKENFLYIGKEKIDSNKFNLVMVVTKETPMEYLSYLRSKNISYIFGGEKELDFSVVFKKLKVEFNIDRVILEGGGSINGSIIAEELIDEISLLLMPLVINNVEAPELFYKQLTTPKLYNFKLEKFEKIERDVLWLRYKRN